MSLIYDLIARPHPIDFAKSVSVDFPHHASCKTLIQVKGPSSGPQLLASEPSEFGPTLGPAGLLDFLLRALWALRPLDREGRYPVDSVLAFGSHVSPWIVERQELHILGARNDSNI